MEQLQLLGGGDYILHVGKRLGTFTERGLEFKVLFEVVGAKLIGHFQRVVVNLHIVLIGLPKVGSLVLRNVFDFVPLLLKRLEVIVYSVHLFWLLNYDLDFLDDGKLLGIVSLTLLFLSLSALCTFGVDCGKQLLQHNLVIIHCGLEIIRVATLFKKLGILRLGVLLMDLIE